MILNVLVQNNAKKCDAYVITAGKSKDRVSIPSSTSLSTVATCFSLSRTTYWKAAVSYEINH